VVKSARLGTAEQARRQPFRIEAVYAAERVRALLEPRRLYAAYALGQLSPDLFALTDCWRATGLESGSGALAVFSRGGLGDAVLTLGEADALAAILSIHPGPRQNYITCEPHHIETVRRFYQLAAEQPMLRMWVTAQTFAAARPPAPGVIVRRMQVTDARLVNRLYNSEGSPTYYSGQQIAAGAYFGVIDDGHLVAVAGTHVFSPEEGIAVVGNVFTHPLWRGRGYAKLATSATTAYLLRRCRDVVLTVDATNTPAVRAYQRLGYRTDCRLIEAAITRRELLPLRSYLRRLRARSRAHEDGNEIVVL
jgi:RimJ/RimL family protein N-acetyltransferase